MPFSPAERELLAPYVTDTEADVFAVTGLSGIVGAVYARYSRAAEGFRETLLKEFVREGQLDPSRAKDLIERVLIAFGDDSVGELEGAHVSFENISILATKEIEDRRIGGSPIEKSTRYVFYDKPDAAGRFRWYRDPAIMASPHAADFTGTMDHIFKTYSGLIAPMQDYYRSRKPLDAAAYDIDGDGEKEKYAGLADDAERKAFERTYATDIRTKACDTLRSLLPLGTLTNVGVFGNGRFFQNVISRCLTSEIPEARDIAGRLRTALDKTVPTYVRRAAASPYEVACRDHVRTLAVKLFVGIAPRRAEDVVLMDRGEAAIADRLCEDGVSPETVRLALLEEDDALTLACMLYPHLRHPLAQIRDVVRGLPAATKREIVAAYVGDRRTRRDRPGRAFEAGYPYTFDMLTDFGTYKDVMRHRMTTQLRQRFTPTEGFRMPDDLAEAGFAALARECADRAAALYEKIVTDFPAQASYAALHGSLVRWVIGMNDREAQHLIELRTTPQGHSSYRRACQAMHRTIAARSPWRAAAIGFVDHNVYDWPRGDAEAMQRVKERALGESLK